MEFSSFDLTGSLPKNLVGQLSGRRATPRALLRRRVFWRATWGEEGKSKKRQ